MTEAQTALARQLASSPRWRWLPGMRLSTPEEPDAYGRVVAVNAPCREHYRRVTGCPDGDGLPWAVVAVWEDLQRVTAWGDPDERDNKPAIPDLSDPLTAAGLLVLAREIAGPTLYTYPTGSGWNAIRSGEVLAWGETEAEALAAVILGGGK